mmetsp:Transcript_3164/g.8747  ORF Transcript_3164/g.8747 Transcript_3164/m.8747 type:complete len:711 (-) Transcript_3164:396-2528(-)
MRAKVGRQAQQLLPPRSCRGEEKHKVGQGQSHDTEHAQHDEAVLDVEQVETVELDVGGPVLDRADLHGEGGLLAKTFGVKSASGVRAALGVDVEAPVHELQHVHVPRLDQNAAAFRDQSALVVPERAQGRKPGPAGGVRESASRPRQAVHRFGIIHSTVSREVSEKVCDFPWAVSIALGVGHHVPQVESRWHPLDELRGRAVQLEIIELVLHQRGKGVPHRGDGLDPSHVVWRVLVRDEESREEHEGQHKEGGKGQGNRDVPEGAGQQQPNVRPAQVDHDQAEAKDCELAAVLLQPNRKIGAGRDQDRDQNLKGVLHQDLAAKVDEDGVRPIRVLPDEDAPLAGEGREHAEHGGEEGAGHEVEQDPRPRHDSGLVLADVPEHRQGDQSRDQSLDQPGREKHLVAEKVLEPPLGEQDDLPPDGDAGLQAKQDDVLDADAALGHLVQQGRLGLLARHRQPPGLVELLELGVPGGAGQVQDVEEKVIARVAERRARVPQVAKVLHRFGGLSPVHGLPAGQQQHVVEHVVQVAGGLVNRHHDRLAEVAQRLQDSPEAVGGVRIEAGGRLVEEYDARVGEELRGDRAPLPLPPGHAPRAVDAGPDDRALALVQAEQADGVCGPLRLLGVRHGVRQPHVRREEDRLLHRHRAQHAIVLVDERGDLADVRRGAGLLAVQNDLAGRLGEVPPENIQQGGLPRAAGSEDRQHPARGVDA